MTQDELIAMAREADLQAAHDFDYRGSVEAMPLNERQEFMKVLAFARLVAAREREEAAMICDGRLRSPSMFATITEAIDHAAAVKGCAAAIRARGMA